MITNVLHISQIKKDPTCLIGLARPAIITKYGDPIAYVVPPKRMQELLEIEEKWLHGENDINDKDITPQT